ncbi:MAG: ATP-dependent DNA helicase, partial [Succinivibrionaceae bacterium]
MSEGSIQDSNIIDEIFAHDGVFSNIINNYCRREGQVLMAKDVEEILYHKFNLIIEAGTGTGKTFGYLVPIIAHNKKAIISTDSKALQDQIMRKDVVMLEKIFNRTLNISLLKGVNNYACYKIIEKLIKKYEKSNDDNEEEKKVYKNNRVLTSDEYNSIKNFVNDTVSGEIQELKFLNAKNTNIDYFRNKIAANSSTCVGRQKCSCADKCYLYKAREIAKKSDIVIVNHALLCTGVLASSDLFPISDIVVIDEAHKFPERVRSTFTIIINSNSIKELLKEISETLFFDKDSDGKSFGRYKDSIMKFEEIKNKIFDIIDLIN